MSELRYTVAMPPGASGGRWTLTPQAQHPVGSLIVALPRSGDITQAGVLVDSGAATLPDVPASVAGQDAASPEYLLELSMTRGGRQIAGTPVRLRMVETAPGIVDVADLLRSGRALAVTPEQMADLRAVKAQAQAAAQSVTDATLDLTQERERVEQALVDTAQTTATLTARVDEAVTDADARMQQARAEALKLGNVDPRFISLTTANPRFPTLEEWQAAGGHDSRIIGSRLEDGGVLLIRYNGATGAWDRYGPPSLTAVSLTYSRPQLTSGAANPPSLATRIWDEHGSLRVRQARNGEVPDLGLTFALYGGRIAEREWDGKNVYTAWYGLNPGDDVSGYRPALAAVPEDGVLHWTPGKYVHGLAGYEGQGDNYNPLWIISKHRFTMRMHGVTVEAAPDLPNTTYYGGWLFLGCTQFRVEGWPIYDGRLDVRDAQKFPLDWWTNPETGNWEPRPDTRIGYSDPNSANLLLDGWRVTVGCVDAYLEVVGDRALMDAIIICGGSNPTDAILTGQPPVDVHLARCVGRRSLRQGLSAVGVDGLTFDGGLYELTGKTKGPDGVERGAPPMAGIDLEGEMTLYNRRVRFINSPEVRHNRGAGVMVHQYTRDTQIESLLVHENDGYGLNIDDTAVGTYVGPGVLLKMNGRDRGPGSEPFEVNMYGEGTVINGATIITDAYRAINNGGTKAGQKLLNVTVKSVGTDPGTPSGWVALANPDLIVDGLTTENVVPMGGYAAVHQFDPPAGTPATGTIRNTRIRTTLGSAAPGLGGTTLNASGNEVVGYAGGNALKSGPATPPRLAFASGAAMNGYTGWEQQRSKIIRQGPSSITYRLYLGAVWDKRDAEQRSTLYVVPPAGWHATVTSVLMQDANNGRLETAFIKSFDSSDALVAVVPAFPAGETGLWVRDIMVDVELRRA